MQEDLVLAVQFLSKYDWSYCINFLLVCALGAFSGFIELVSRYSNVDKLRRIQAGWMYIILNAGIAGLVYVLIVRGEFQFNFGKYKSGPLASVIMAGTSAMIILRSSIVNVKLNNNDVPVGLAPLLQVLLNWVNRSYDRENSIMDLAQVSIIMEGVGFDVLERNLRSLCVAMMKTLSAEEMTAIGNNVSKISQDTEIDEITKKLNLGLLLVPYMGTQLLGDAVQQLKKISSAQQQPLDEPVNQLEQLLKIYNDSDQ